MSGVDFSKAVALQFGNPDERLVKALNEHMLRGLNDALERVAGRNVPFVLILATDTATFHGGNREAYLLRDLLLEYSARLADQKANGLPP